MSKTQKGWATFGKLSAVIATIGTITTLYLAFFPAKPKLVAVGHYHEFVLPPDLSETINNLYSATSFLSLNTFFENINDTNNSYSTFENYKIASALSKHLESFLPESFHYRNSPYGGFVYLEIRNRGNREASDIVMDVPSPGIALITATDDTQSTQVVEKKVLLGSLRPKNSKRVSLWLRNNVSEYAEDEFIITHADGVGKVRFGRVYSGFAQFIARFYFWILWGLFWIGLIIWIHTSHKPARNEGDLTSNT